MNSISLYDSYQKKIARISPDSTVEKGVLKIYSCGPTVYYYMHIGNLRATWLPDVIARVGKMSGYKIQWVQNITDVGHLVDDGDDGEDKLEKGAKRENKSVSEIVDFYTEDFRQQCAALNISLPSGNYQPKASEYIKEQMILALELLRDNKAYLLEDGIYYRSEKNSPSQNGWQSQTDGVVLQDSEINHELTEIALNKNKLVEKWWTSKFPEIELKKVELFDNGMVCNFNLNDTLLLKILSPKYTWDKRSTQNFENFYKNYCDIKNLNLEYVPQIEITEMSEIFNAPVVLMELVDVQDLSEIYHKASTQEKQKYLNKFVNLIKALNSNKSETNTDNVLTHQDLHLGNILVDKATDNLWLIDFDNLAFSSIEDEFYGILQGFLLPTACVSEELEKFYPKPLYEEFVEIIKTYPEVLPQDIDKIKTVFKDCFDEKLEVNKFTSVLEPLYKLVFENNLFELLVQKKYTQALALFEKEFAEKINYTGREIVNTTKNPEDFALWKFVDESSLQKWKFNQEPETEKVMAAIYQNDSSIDPALPNRWGCPGWHSECVAMICSILGTDRFTKNNSFDYTNGLDLNKPVIDIHTGGEDHIDIHHKNEILQSNSLGLKLSQTWVHNKFVVVDNKKMAKSVGNVFMVTGEYDKTGFYSITKPPLEITTHLEKKYAVTGFDPLSYRLMLLEHHYTEQINFTWEKLEQSQNRLWNIRKEMAKVQSFARLNNITEIVEDKQIQVLLNYLTDNLNIPKFIEKYQSFLLDVTTEISKNQTLNPKNLGALNYFEKEFLNLNLNPELTIEILELGRQRLEAKQQKDYPKSDQIRDEILSLGFQIDDYSWGYGFWSRR